MFFEFKRVRRNPYSPTPYPPEKPIRLDEVRLDAWAHALGQCREWDGRVSALRHRLAARLFRRILAVRGKHPAEEVGIADKRRSGLGDFRSSSYVWLIEAESNPAERGEGTLHESGNLHEGQAAPTASQD
jgi:hypothetical protein